MSERADIFADDLDLSGFAPKKRSGPPPEEVRKAAEGSAFKSREPEAKAREPERKSRRERRIYRTGRDAHFSCKADPAVIDEFYAISNAQDWVMGETLERAVAALKRELAKTRPA